MEWVKLKKMIEQRYFEKNSLYNLNNRSEYEYKWRISSIKRKEKRRKKSEAVKVLWKCTIKKFWKKYRLLQDDFHGPACLSFRRGRGWFDKK